MQQDSDLHRHSGLRKIHRSDVHVRRPGGDDHFMNNWDHFMQRSGPNPCADKLSIMREKLNSGHSSSTDPVLPWPEPTTDADEHVRPISFVIPAYNESGTIPDTIAQIRSHVPAKWLAEIVVVDNGSTDDTAVVATGLGARVITAPGAALGAMRNLGASCATGEILVFLDSDVSLTQSWNDSLPTLSRTLNADPGVITGSWCEVPDDAGWVPRVWSPGAPKRGEVRHLGSAHLIVTAATFRQLGGFDEDLPTGEDFEFCSRALAKGHRVVALPELRAIHRGEPRSVIDFVRREIWHGTGDAGSIRSILKSPVALGAIAFALVHTLIPIGLSVAAPLGTTLLVGGVVTVFGLVVAAMIRKKPPATLRDRVLLLWLIYLYLWARFLSILVSAAGFRLDSPRRGQPADLRRPAGK
jgi:hypothetical protein